MQQPGLKQNINTFKASVQNLTYWPQQQERKKEEITKQLYCTHSFLTMKCLFYMLLSNKKKTSKKFWYKKEKHSQKLPLYTGTH